MKERLEYLRGELRAERISLGELIELQANAEFIDPGDVELLEAAGVPEFCEHGYRHDERCPDCDIANHLPTVLPVGGDPRRTEIIEDDDVA